MAVPDGGVLSPSHYPYPLHKPELMMETDPGYWDSQQKATLPPGEIDSKAYTYPAVEMAFQSSRHNGVLPPIARVVIRESIHKSPKGQFDGDRFHCTVRFLTQADLTKFYNAHVRCEHNDEAGDKKVGFHWAAEDVFWPPK